jgi:hypothetical protein
MDRNMSGAYKTFALDVTLSDEALPLLDTIRLYIDGIPYNRGGQVLTWTCTERSRSCCRFRTRSPYNEEITSLQAKCMLSHCMSLIAASITGFRFEARFLVSAITTEGTLLNENGVISESCRQRCCRPIAPVTRRPCNIQRNASLPTQLHERPAFLSGLDTPLQYIEPPMNESVGAFRDDSDQIGQSAE